MFETNQLALFSNHSLNVISKVKSEIKLLVSNSRQSVDEIADLMNAVMSREGVNGRVSRSIVQSWTKNDASRMPSLIQLMVFCYVMGSMTPFQAAVAPLRYKLIGPEDIEVLNFGMAEILKRRAARKAKIALDLIEVK